MKLVSHNLFRGAENTYPKLLEFVHQQKPDIVCFQEATGWQDGTPSCLGRFAAATALHSYVYGDSNTRYKLATFSGLPILSSEVHTEGFWHSAVRSTVEYGDDVLSVWNIHSNPKSEDARLTEIERLGELIDPEELAIVVGDFNSLSEADQYPTDLKDVLAAEGVTKFGVDELRFDVTKRLSQLGLVDVAAAHDMLENTVPTPANEDTQHAAALRLDYMFATHSLMGAVRKIEVPKNELTDRISDHYPVVLTLE